MPENLGNELDEQEQYSRRINRKGFHEYSRGTGGVCWIIIVLDTANMIMNIAYIFSQKLLLFSATEITMLEFNLKPDFV